MRTQSIIAAVVTALLFTVVGARAEAQSADALSAPRVSLSLSTGAVAEAASAPDAPRLVLSPPELRLETRRRRARQARMVGAVATGVGAAVVLGGALGAVAYSCDDWLCIGPLGAYLTMIAGASVVTSGLIVYLVGHGIEAASHPVRVGVGFDRHGGQLGVTAAF